MNKLKRQPGLMLILATGALWGLIEFGAGLGLQKCATLMTGSILTGLSFFWISFIWSQHKKILSILFVLLLAISLKWMDALLLQLPWNHGSVLNPMFALFAAALGFSILMLFFRKNYFKNLSSRILLGGTSALLATSLFPLFKIASGIPACTWAVTQIPLSIATAPIAILLAMITVPLGHRAASWLNERTRETPITGISISYGQWTTAVFLLSVLILVLARIS